jgi:hypothetical protein
MENIEKCMDIVDITDGQPAGIVAAVLAGLALAAAMVAAVMAAA